MHGRSVLHLHTAEYGAALDDERFDIGEIRRIRMQRLVGERAEYGGATELAIPVWRDLDLDSAEYRIDMQGRRVAGDSGAGEVELVTAEYRLHFAAFKLRRHQHALAAREDHL